MDNFDKIISIKKIRDVVLDYSDNKHKIDTCMLYKTCKSQERYSVMLSSKELDDINELNNIIDFIKYTKANSLLDTVLFCHTEDKNIDRIKSIIDKEKGLFITYPSSKDLFETELFDIIIINLKN